MDEEDYNYLKILAWILLACFILVGLMLMYAIRISAQENSTNTTIINNTYVLNNTYNYTYIYNYTLNYTYFINQTTGDNITVYNYTNITCVNCIYNYTNVTILDGEYNNVTYLYYFNGSNFSQDQYYNKSVLDERFDKYILKKDFPAIANFSNATSTTWRPADTFLSIGVVVSLLIGVVSLIFIIKGGFD